MSKKPKVSKGRGHVTAESGDQASNSLPTTKASVQVKKASPSSSKPLPAPSKPGKAKASGGGSTAGTGPTTRGGNRNVKWGGGETPSRSLYTDGPTSRAGKRKPKDTKSGASRSTKGKTSEKSGASRSTAGKVKPEGFIQKVRKTLADGFKGGFMKKNRKEK